MYIFSEAFQTESVARTIFFPTEISGFPCKLYVPLVYYFTEMVTLGATLIWSFTIYDNNNKENVQKDCPTTAWNFPIWRFMADENTSTRNCFFPFCKSLEKLNPIMKIRPHLTNWARFNKRCIVWKNSTALNLPWRFQ